ncbi:hypothetical protein BZA70DRAFT_276492 [Myxozyma melibiosi]|uniref:F-box domain-containing protein n=1 Tax=Myxozyma melibiosi TaxID=54550 RepID=A0ABR1F980_9ASCO
MQRTAGVDWSLLPAELFGEILSYLVFPPVLELRLVSKAWEKAVVGYVVMTHQAFKRSMLLDVSGLWMAGTAKPFKSRTVLEVMEKYCRFIERLADSACAGLYKVPSEEALRLSNIVTLHLQIVQFAELVIDSLRELVSRQKTQVCFARLTELHVLYGTGSIRHMRNTLLSDGNSGVFILKKYAGLINRAFPAVVRLEFGCEDVERLDRFVDEFDHPVRGLPFTTLDFVANLAGRAKIEYVAIRGIRFLGRRPLPTLPLSSSIRRFEMEYCWIIKPLRIVVNKFVGMDDDEEGLMAVQLMLAEAEKGEQRGRGFSIVPQKSNPKLVRKIVLSRAREDGDEEDGDSMKADYNLSYTIADEEGESKVGFFS